MHHPGYCLIPRWCVFLLYAVLFFYLNPFGIIVAVMLLNNKFLKMRDTVYNNAINNSCDASVDELITYLNKYRCEDRPNAWHQLRGVWFAINESPNVSTEKKRQLKTLLLTKGLYLHKEEGQIIDNYLK